jgi:hypothetical protein
MSTFQEDETEIENPDGVDWIEPGDDGASLGETSGDLNHLIDQALDNSVKSGSGGRGVGSSSSGLRTFKANYLTTANAHKSKDTGNRVIAHVDLDCFYVQVERSHNPELKGKPCAVVQCKLGLST